MLGFVDTKMFVVPNIHQSVVAFPVVGIMLSRETLPAEQVVYGDSGYIGLEKREEILKDTVLSVVEYRINRRPKSIQKTPEPMN